MKKLYPFNLFLTVTTLIVVNLYFTSFINAQSTLQVSSAITPQQMVQEILIGGGVVTSNITYTGNNISRGKFWGGPGSIGISDGIILTSGNVTVAPGPNNAAGAGADSGQGGDPDLQQISGVNINDACILEFDFIPQSTTVSFKYVFGSEEYHEYVNQFNDAFGFFISGPGIDGPFTNNAKNIALIPLSETPVTINTVNCGNPYDCANHCMNCVFFKNNPQGQTFCQYDAFTTVLRAWATVIPCETYHIKLAIGDGIDHAYDSGVFLEANSFSSVGIASDILYTAPDDHFLIEGCNNASIMFTLSVQPDADYYMPIMISGTATNGLDYEQIPDSVFFAQGYSQAWLDIVTLPDQLTEWFENIRIVFNSSLCSIDYDTILLTINDYNLTLNMSPDTVINCATEAHIGIENINGFGPYTISWNTGDTTPYITVSPLISTTYYVTVAALCDSTTTDSVRVIVDGPSSNAGSDLSIPYGTNTTLQGSASQGSGDYTYSWEPADKLIDPTVATPTTISMDQTTPFNLTVTDLAGGCQDLDQMILFITGGPLNVGPAANPSSICFGESSQLISYASGGSENYSYSWTSNPPGFVSTIPEPIVEPTVTTTYYVTINDGYNTVSGNVTVTVQPLPVPEAGENDTIWNGTWGHLYGSGSQGSGTYTWTWQPFDKLLNPYSPTPTTVKLYETTLFRLSITDNVSGCVSEGEDLVTVVVNGGPLAVTAEVSDPGICRGETTQLHALPSGGNQGQYSYQWSSVPVGFSDTVREPFITPTVSTAYTVKVYDQYNYFEASVSVDVSQPPLVNLGADILACPFDTVKLMTNIPGMAYYWSNGSDAPSINIGSTGIGYDAKTIWLRVENDQGCFGTDTIHIVFDFAQCSGVKEQSDEGAEIYIYPNPTTGKVQVEWKGMSGTVKMQITDIHGDVVISRSVQSPPSGDYKGSFDLKGQAEGIYLLKLVGEDKVLVRKIVLR
jgi:hypothetical protein